MPHASGHSVAITPEAQAAIDRKKREKFFVQQADEGNVVQSEFPTYVPTTPVAPGTDFSAEKERSKSYIDLAKGGTVDEQMQKGLPTYIPTDPVAPSVSPEVRAEQEQEELRRRYKDVKAKATARGFNYDDSQIADLLGVTLAEINAIKSAPATYMPNAPVNPTESPQGRGRVDEEVKGDTSLLPAGGVKPSGNDPKYNTPDSEFTTTSIPSEEDKKRILTTNTGYEGRDKVLVKGEEKDYAPGYETDAEIEQRQREEKARIDEQQREEQRQRNIKAEEDRKLAEQQEQAAAREASGIINEIPINLPKNL